MEHVPVLLNEVLQMATQTERPVQRILDGTFGRGGHTRALLEAFPQCRILALDCDAEAIEFGRRSFEHEVTQKRIYLIQGNFSDIATLKESFPEPFKNHLFDLVLLDLGVSSPQLDQPERGFSFYHQGPLDMRMDRRQELSAQDIVNTWEEQDLIELFQTLGEIRRPHRVVRAIKEKRKQELFHNTSDLSHLIESVEGWTRKGHHPATRYFLALRLKVNQELERIENVIPTLIAELSSGGRLLIITFHSLEDRIVKVGFKKMQDAGRIITKKVIQAEWSEKKKNPRARSAKLRVFQKGGINESSAGE